MKKFEAPPGYFESLPTERRIAYLQLTARQIGEKLKVERERLNYIKEEIKNIDKKLDSANKKLAGEHAD